MSMAVKPGVIETIPEKCRRCYSCVRECPVKAIKVEGGQARVIPERCIGCGNCYRVCSQAAKKILDGKEPVRQALADSSRARIAILAPSFPAAFAGLNPERFTGALRALGFDRIMEVAFGADLNSRLYHDMRDSSCAKPIIATACPAVIYYVQKYAPELLKNLAPLASPMVVTARVARSLHGEDSFVCFIGPCVGKKLEARDPLTGGVVDEVLTFQELAQLFTEAGIDPTEAEAAEMDGPKAGLGHLFPLTSGLLRSADIREGVLDASIISANGRRRCMWYLEDLSRDHLNADFVDLLFCEGCINGPAMAHHANLFSRRQHVTEYARERFSGLDFEQWQQEVMMWLGKVDQGRQYESDPQHLPSPPAEEVARVLKYMGKEKPEDELNCGACGYSSCREKAEAVCKGLAEVEMCLPFLVDKLESTCQQLQKTNRVLQETQQSLIQTEKLASMGQLAAGVAHEINNPLGSILMFSHLLLDSLTEGDPNRQDIDLIVREAHRCKNIVSGLLNFARQNRVTLQQVEARELLEDMCRKWAQDPKFESIELPVEVAPDAGPVWLDGDQFRQVLDNLVHNAAEAMEGKGRISLRASRLESGSMVFEVEDNGCGIPEENLGRIFTPFFTTKKLGKGTGLGLAIAYGIVKMHGGNIEVDSKIGRGTKFRITMPDRPPVGGGMDWIT